MAIGAVISAVTARIGATWTSADGTSMPVVLPNTTGEVPAVPFLALQFPVSTERHVGMAGVGNRTFREDGAFRIILTVTRGEGQSQAIGWIDELRALFRAQQFGGVTTFSPSPATDNDNNDMGSYWLLSFSVVYFFDLLA